MTWHALLLLLRPAAVKAHLDDLEARGKVKVKPNVWQIELGVLRMWHRVFFRPETVGASSQAPRDTWRARLLHRRSLRAVVLVAERAIAPFDHSGLAQPSWRMVRHLLAAHHDGGQSVYDLEILAAEPAALAQVIAEAQAVVDGTHPRATWLRDLVVFEGYHENLLRLAQAVQAGALPLMPEDIDNPDISFQAFLRWCAAQPSDPASTLAAWRSGVFPAPLLPANAP